MLITAFTPSGAVIWATQIGSASDDWAQGVDADSEGNTYFTMISSGIVLGFNPIGTVDALVGKLSTDGTILWVQPTHSPHPPTLCLAASTSHSICKVHWPKMAGGRRSAGVGGVGVGLGVLECGVVTSGVYLLNYTLHNNFCNFVFRCGCTFPWAGSW